MNGQSVVFMKEVVEMLNEAFPPAKNIPTTLIEGRRYVQASVDETPYFSAYFSKQTQRWWLYCINYLVWRQKEYQQAVEDIEELVKQKGFKMAEAYVFYSAIDSLKKNKKPGDIFIGHTLPKITIKR